MRLWRRPSNDQGTHGDLVDPASGRGGVLRVTPAGANGAGIDPDLQEAAMREHWLDRLARRMATRRGLARLGLGGALAALGLTPDEAAAACRAPKKPCEKGRQCCTKRCRRGKCAPCPNGAKFLPAPDLLCWLSWGTGGLGNGQLRFPKGVAVGGDGSVYVADTGNNRIQQFDATGLFIRKWGSFGTGDGQFKGPRGVAAGAGHIYVADTRNHRVVRVRPL